MAPRFLIFLCCIAAAYALPGKAEFDGFLKNFKRSYSGAEYAKRLGIFVKNMLEAERLNSSKEIGGFFGANRFADSTPEEFQKLLMPIDFEKTRNFVANNNIDSSIPPPNKNGAVVDGLSRRKRQATPPSSFDYRTYGWVTSIKNQGNCGACWAFATSALIESAYLRSQYGTYDTSEQLLVDCTYPTNNACSGGWVDVAMNYVKQYGTTYESVYPYRAVRQTCGTVASANRFAGVDYYIVASEAAIASALYNYGAVAFYFTVPPAFMHYTGGVFDSNDCNTGSTGLHEMTIIGYTSTYWILKNSWGTTFGDQGFVYWKRGKNLCNMRQLLCVYAPVAAG